MKSFLVSAILLAVMCVSVSGYAATWYVEGSVPPSQDGKSCETALETIQEGIDKGRQRDPLDQGAVAGTVIDANKTGSLVTFLGDETKTLCAMAQRGRAKGRGRKP